MEVAATMTPYHEGDGVRFFLGDCRDVMAQVEPESVSCVSCSPPFFGLRKYTCEPSIWPSEMPGCDDCPHDFAVEHTGKASHYKGRKRWQHLAEQAQETGQPIRDVIPTAWGHPEYSQGATCSLCGAWRGQLGLEPTVKMYVEHTIEWLRAVKRVLRKDGVVWLDIDDSRSATGGPQVKGTKQVAGSQDGAWGGRSRKATMPKSLSLIPQRIAIAAQEDGWIVRSEIIIPTWMPESAKDRPTDACRKVLMLVNSKAYWYDGEAVRQPCSENWRYGGGPPMPELGDHVLETGYSGHQVQRIYDEAKGRNLGSVWDDIPPAAYPDSHFAVYPVEEPERCILASCPAEICVKCGKARRRVVGKSIRRPHPDRWVPDEIADNYKFGEGYREGGRTLGARAEIPTLGWTDCGCNGGWASGVVLDPFVGTGTTCIAARKLNRKCIGIDASEDYLQQAVTRLTVGDAGIRRMVEARKQGYEQMTLFSGPAGPEGG